MKSATALMVDALSMMRAAGLADFGTWPKDDAGLVLKAKAYAQVMEMRGISPAFIEKATCLCINTRSALPSAAEFAAICQGIVDDETELVPIGEHNGRVMLRRIPSRLTPEHRLKVVNAHRKEAGLPPMAKALEFEPAPADAMVKLSEILGRAEKPMTGGKANHGRKTEVEEGTGD